MFGYKFPGLDSAALSNKWYQIQKSEKHVKTSPGHTLTGEPGSRKTL
jgi:hypothetical protein